MSRQCAFGVAGVVLAALLFREYEESRLWSAAAKYYLQQASVNRDLILRSCEHEMKREEIFDPDERWAESPFLQRGDRGLDGSLAWSAHYEFTLQFFRVRFVNGKAFENSVVCDVMPHMGSRDGIYVSVHTIFDKSDLSLDRD